MTPRMQEIADAVFRVGVSAAARELGISHSTITATMARVRAQTYALAGHRIGDPHDCFVMDCRGLGPEVERLRHLLREREAIDGDAYDDEAAADATSGRWTSSGVRVVIADQHVMPGWQDHTPTAACWCQPVPQDEVIGLDAVLRRTWLHRAAHDDPHRYPEESDPALNVLGREWVVQRGGDRRDR